MNLTLLLLLRLQLLSRRRGDRSEDLLTGGVHRQDVLPPADNHSLEGRKGNTLVIGYSIYVVNQVSDNLLHRQFTQRISLLPNEYYILVICPEVVIISDKHCSS